MITGAKSTTSGLVGVGLYTPAEAGRLVKIAPNKIVRWLRGHSVSGRVYDPLWQPQADLGEDGLFLGFRDLMEIRVANAFINQGLSAQKVRKAILLARELIDEEHPLSTKRFKTDGRSVFLQVAEEDGTTRLIDLFKKQYAFAGIVEKSLKDTEFDSEGSPARWWPLGRSRSVLIDPTRSFGQPIESETSIPAETLANAAIAEGSVQAAARVWQVNVRSVRHAVNFQREMANRKAA